MNIKDIIERLPVLTVLFILLIVPFILTVINIINNFKVRPFKQRFYDSVTMVIGIIFTTILYDLFEKDFHEPIVSGRGDAALHRYLASWHAPTILILALIAITAFFILNHCKDKLSPVLIALCLSGIYIGVGLSAAIIVQASSHFFDDGIFGIPLM